MKMGISWRQAAAITKGRLTSGHEGEIFNSFTTDSRLAHSGDVFMALRGEKHDAHDFIAQALAQGASSIIAENGWLEKHPTRARHILGVENTLHALWALAAAHRMRCNIPVAAITGSNGKSTTKEMLRGIFSVRGQVCANKGNLNNQYGAPLSVLELSEADKFAVFELGASRQGDIRDTGSVVRPDIGVIINVSAAHLQFFGDLETVYKTKTEMTECIKEGGTLVYNADDPRLAEHIVFSKTMKYMNFGFNEKADVRIMTETGPVVLSCKGENIELPLTLRRHDRLNAAAACAAALCAGFTRAEIAEGFGLFRPMPMRLQIEKIGSTTFILDAYNANPASMKAALTALCESANPRPLTAVLGDMRELGAYSAKYHAELGAAAAQNAAISAVYLAGPEMKPGYDAALAAGGQEKVKYSPEPDGWFDDLLARAKHGGTVLIKASRAMGFEKIFEKIKSSKGN